MITLTVISYNGGPAEAGLSASFDELGGTIGRADTNQLVLPDPERTISRVHAQISFRAGRFAVIDRGSNPIQVNGQPVGSGKEALIGEGDQVLIGGYLLGVRLGGGSSRAPADPFGELEGGGAKERPGQGDQPVAGPSRDMLVAARHVDGRRRESEWSASRHRTKRRL